MTPFSLLADTPAGRRRLPVVILTVASSHADKLLIQSPKPIVPAVDRVEVVITDSTIRERLWVR